MSSPAAARAAARRQAILARGSDRLSKLTTSARGDDAPQFHDDPPVPPLPEKPRQSSLEQFVGEETSRHTPAPAPGANPFDMFGIGAPPSDPSAWTPEQQQQFLHAIMGGVGASSDSSASSPFGALPQSGPAAPNSQPSDALTNMMNMMPPPPQQPKPKTLAHKLLPIIHILSVWALVAYYTFIAEPATSGAPVSSQAIARRWSSLATSRPIEALWGTGPVPFIWAFATLQLALHSIRIFTGLDEVNPPMLLAIALPHLPPTLSSTIRHGLKYIKMGGALLDDLAAAIFALAVGVVIASYLE